MNKCNKCGYCQNHCCCENACPKCNEGKEEIIDETIQECPGIIEEEELPEIEEYKECGCEDGCPSCWHEELEIDEKPNKERETDEDHD